MKQGLYLPIVYVAPSIWNVALLHFLKSFDPRPGILMVRVGLEAVACRVIVAPPPSPFPPIAPRKCSMPPTSLVVRVGGWETPLSLSVRLPDRLAWLAADVEPVRPRDFDPAMALAEDEDGRTDVVVVGVACCACAPLNDGVVFIAANNETGCEFEADDDNMFVVRRWEVAGATESAFEVSAVAVVDGDEVDDAVGCGDWVVTQSRLFVPVPDMLSLGAQYILLLLNNGTIHRQHEEKVIYDYQFIGISFPVNR